MTPQGPLTRVPVSTDVAFSRLLARHPDWNMRRQRSGYFAVKAVLEVCYVAASDTVSGLADVIAAIERGDIPDDGC